VIRLKSVVQRLSGALITDAEILLFERKTTKFDPLVSSGYALVESPIREQE
jgi:hypothetical protein